MQTPIHRAEMCLLLGLIAGLVFAVFGPPLTQYAHYHAFADQRTLWGLPFALDVVSNLPFALFGGWGLWLSRQGRTEDTNKYRRSLANLFFVGLLVTAACSSWYHLHPDDLRLAIDRLGMVVAFAGLLGLAVADRISEEAGLITAAAATVLGPLAIAVWAAHGNLLPWSVFQAGGMLLLVVLALQKPVRGAWGLPLMAVVGWYVLAKLLELTDGLVFLASAELVSGHTLKHFTAAMAAFPVISVMHNVAKVSCQRNCAAHSLGLQ
jgi:FtsH-binding integral membrane protein